MQDIVVTQNTPDWFVAQQPPASAMSLIFVVLPLLFFLVFWTFKRYWRGAAFMLIGAPVFIYFMIPSKDFYRVTIDRRAHSILSKKINKDGTVLSEKRILASDLASAEMKFNRGDPLIVLVHRDGHESYPLGDEYIQGRGERVCCSERPERGSWPDSGGGSGALTIHSTLL